MKQLIEQIKKTVVFLGRTNKSGESTIDSTGFLVQVKGFYHLLTAKHVVMDLNTGELIDKDMFVSCNSKTKDINAHKIIDIKKQFGVDWIFHQDGKVDIAIIPFAINTADDDVKVIPDTLFLMPAELQELYDVFFLSYQPNVTFGKKISPAFRGGTISIINEDETFYIDASAFPGNSGSPVFLKPSAVRFTDKGISLGGDKLGGKFIGIVGEYVPYQEIAISSQTRRPRIVFEENTGLSRVWSVKYVNEILSSTEFVTQLGKLKK